MTPLYQHFNRQKIIPIPNLLDVNKSNLWYQADYNLLEVLMDCKPVIRWAFYNKLHMPQVEQDFHPVAQGGVETATP